MKRLPKLLPVLIAACFASNAHADSGYFSGVKGARASGRAGAFTAKADDLSAAYLNPAGLSHIEDTSFQVGNRFSYNSVTYTRAPTLNWGDPQNGAPPYVEFDAVENGTPWQLLDPFLGVASTLGIRDWTFALVAYTPAGTGRSEFPLDGGQRYMMVRRNVAILNYTASAAWQPNERWSFGASAQWIHVPWLEYELVIDANQFGRAVNPVSSELDMLARTSGSDPFTFNAIVGGWFRPIPALEFGLSGQVIPAAIETRSKLSLEALSSEIDEAPELRRNGEPADDVTLTLPLPLTARAGARYRGLEGDRELYDVEVDVVYENWSRVDRFSVDGSGLIATLMEVDVDVGQIEISKQWRDSLSVHAGGDYALLSDRLTLRGGAFFSTAVSPPAYANVDFASGRYVGGAVGGSFFAGNAEVAFAYELRRQLPLSVTEANARVYQEAPANPCTSPFTDPTVCHEQFLGQGTPAVNAGRYDAYSHVLSVDVRYHL